MYIYIYICVCVYTVAPCRKQPYSPTIHPGLLGSQPPMFWMFWCQKNCRLYSGGISWTGGSRMGSPTKTYPQRNPALSF